MVKMGLHYQKYNFLTMGVAGTGEEKTNLTRGEKSGGGNQISVPRKAIPTR
jgi:hypothetical protein